MWFLSWRKRRLDLPLCGGSAAAGAVAAGFAGGLAAGFAPRRCRLAWGVMNNKPATAKTKTKTTARRRVVKLLEKVGAFVIFIREYQIPNTKWIFARLVAFQLTAC
jgi:hypothetical protein